MLDTIRESIEGFHAALEAAYGELTRSTARIEDRKQKILELLGTSIRVPEPPEGTGAYVDACRDVLEQVKRDLRQWQNALALQVERSEFVNRHEKSILVIAFADVKAGKSTLGNFAAGHYLKDTPYEDLYQPLNYSIEDFSAASGENRTVREHPMPFPEDEIEATSAIQYYTLHQGLTWVDTPGLHSLTREHGALTEEYVQFADLVLFLTSSNSPLKEDERGELEKLLKQDKPVMVVITKSDMNKRTVKDGRLCSVLVPKAQENRKAQEKYVMEEISRLGSGKIENRRAVSVSTKLACDALMEGNGEKFADSNLPVFFSQMSEILSTKAVELKMRRPASEVNQCIRQLLEGDSKGGTSIRQERVRLEESIRELEGLRLDRQQLIGKIMLELDMVLPTEMSLVFRNLRERGLLDEPESVREAVTKRLSAVCTAHCLKVFQEKLKSGHIDLLGVTELRLDSNVGGGYQKTYMSQTYTTMERRPPKNILEHAQKLFDKDKEFYRSVSHTEQVAVGDNFSSYLQSTWKAVRPQIEVLVSQTADSLYEQCIDPLQQRYVQMDGQFKSLAEQLEKLRFQEGE